MYENIPSKSWKSSIFPINSPAELLSKPSKTFIMEKTLLPEDIIEGEVFRLGEDINNDPNAIFIEFSKSISLEKLLKIKNSSEAEKSYLSLID